MQEKANAGCEKAHQRRTAHWAGTGAHGDWIGNLMPQEKGNYFDLLLSLCFSSITIL